MVLWLHVVARKLLLQLQTTWILDLVHFIAPNWQKKAIKTLKKRANHKFGKKKSLARHQVACVLIVVARCSGACCCRWLNVSEAAWSRCNREIRLPERRLFDYVVVVVVVYCAVLPVRLTPMCAHASSYACLSRSYVWQQVREQMVVTCSSNSSGKQKETCLLFLSNVRTWITCWASINSVATFSKFW